MNITKVWQSDGVKGIEQTLQQMRKLVVESDENRDIKRKAREIIQGIPPGDEIAQIQAIFRWVQENMAYVRDIYGTEELTRPDRIVQSIITNANTHSSDCDDFAMTLSALLRAVGFQTRLEALAVVSPDGYDHARAAVFVQKLNKWWRLEATKPGMPPGTGIPSKMPILSLEVY